MNVTSKQVVIYLVVLLIFFLLGWFVDLISDVTIMNGSGSAFYIEHHLFHNTYLFLENHNQITHNKIILKWDRLYLLIVVAFMLAVSIRTYIKNDSSTGVNQP